VRSLNEEIQRTIDDNIELDAKWAEKLKEDATYAQIAYRKRERIFKWVGRAFSAVPIVGHYIAPALEAMWNTAEVIKEGIGEEMDRNAETSLKRFEWYYTIVEQRKKFR